MGIIEDWNLTTADLDAILAERPSARGMLVGFVAEYKLQRGVLTDSRIHKLRRYDDHDRSRPADFSLEYKGQEITVEVKSLQTKSVKQTPSGFEGRCQVDASDKRQVTLPDGSNLDTTCLLTGKFDLLAVNLYEFRQKWEYAFIRNQDLPRSRHQKYTEFQRKHLLATTVRINWPLSKPFSADPFKLLDDIVRDRAKSLDLTSTESSDVDSGMNPASRLHQTQGTLNLPQSP